MSCGSPLQRRVTLGTCVRTRPQRSRCSGRRSAGAEATEGSSSSAGRASCAAAALEAERLYAKRFKAYKGDLRAYRFYRLRTSRMKLFDEHVLGAGTFVTVKVEAKGRVRWERTESYT